MPCLIIPGKGEKIKEVIEKLARAPKKEIQKLYKYLDRRIERQLARPAIVLEILYRTGLFNAIFKKSLDDINELQAEMKKTLKF